MNQQKYTFRKARPGDFGFLYELNKITMKNHVVQTWGKWDEKEQMDYLKKIFKPEDYQIILVNSKEAGTLVVIEKDNKIKIDRLQIMPEFQGSGIGTAILDKLITKTQKNQKSLCLTVLKSNERAKQLYEKKGFQVTRENNERYFMSFKESHQNTSLNTG